MVHLSIGGNDVLVQWDVGFTQAELDDLTNEVYDQVLEIFDFIKSARPGIKIVFSGYCYPNFGEVIESAAPLQNVHPFYGTWSSMGFPSFLQINTILNEFSHEMEDYAATDPQVEFFKATGLSNTLLAKMTLWELLQEEATPPFTLHTPYGDSNYPSPKGYRDLISYHTQKFYHKYFMDDQYFLSTEKEGELVMRTPHQVNYLLVLMPAKNMPLY